MKTALIALALLVASTAFAQQSTPVDAPTQPADFTTEADSAAPADYIAEADSAAPADSTAAADSAAPAASTAKADPEYRRLDEEARNAFRDGGHEEAARLWRQVLSSPEARSYRSHALYNMACAWSLAAQPDSAFACLEEAIRAGYDNLAWLAADSDFDFLRREHAERFAAFEEAAPRLVRRSSSTTRPLR